RGTRRITLCSFTDWHGDSKGHFPNSRFGIGKCRLKQTTRGGHSTRPLSGTTREKSFVLYSFQGHSRHHPEHVRKSERYSDDRRLYCVQASGPVRERTHATVRDIQKRS